jgi:hypothetical protein
MRTTRPQLLWTFQLYLDKLKIMEPERRDRLSQMFLERALSRATEIEFLAWLKTNRLMPSKIVMRTRGSRLAWFSAWLNRYRPFADRGERERLIRLYNDRTLSRDIEREFHAYVKAEVLRQDIGYVFNGR